MKKLISMLLCAALLLSALAACSKDAPQDGQTAGRLPDLMVMSGPTGVGSAKLISEWEAGASVVASATVVADNEEVKNALINGDADIAAVATNVASALYNKTGGAIQVLAINTLGVLYLVTNGSVAVESIEDLAGQTVYAPAQNPTFIFQHIVNAAGLTDVTIDNTYAQPADLNTAVASGQVSIAVLPEPMVTVAKSKNPNLQVVLDLTAEWDKVSPAGSLVQGCVVVRKDFALENVAAVNTFLDEYTVSIETLVEDVEGTAAKIEANGIFAKAAVAAKAIPNCNVCFITGSEMKTALAEFLTIMHGVAPASVGGPADDFYYIAE